MNLGKAKTVLIIAFLSLNLFLSYHLFWPDFGRLTRVAITADELSSLENLLRDHNYSLAVPLDRSVHTGNFLTVTPAVEPRQRIWTQFMADGASISELDGTYVFRRPGEDAVFNPSGLTRLIYNPPHLLTADSTPPLEGDLRPLVEGFLQERAIWPADLVFDYREDDGRGTTTFHYHQQVEGIPLFAGQLKVTLDSNYLTAVEIYWLEPEEGLPAREMEVISAAEALTNLLGEIGPSSEPSLILNIELGYFSGEYDAEKWEIPPVWRIALDRNRYYYINAFTGNLEQGTIIPQQDS